MLTEIRRTGWGESMDEHVEQINQSEHVGQSEQIIELNLSFKYENESEAALKDVRGSVSRGKCVVLCGGSGCGKSTLLRCINRLIPQFYEGELKGFCMLCGKDISKRAIGETGELAASVFQDPRSQFFTMNSSTEVAFGLENFGATHEQMVKRVELAFSSFHLERLKDRSVFELSSGERQLVAILAAWAVDTDVLLLDEPTANLDFCAVEMLRKMLLELKSRGKTMLISEHRMYYLRELADEYWYMENGEITRRFAADEMEALADSELCRLGLRATDLNAVARTCHDSMPPSCKNELAVSGVVFGYNRRKKVLNGLSLRACTGEVIGLVGSNGCGKTTFGKLAAGLLKPSAGGFTYNGACMRSRELLKQSMFIMQESEFQFFTNSVQNELRYGRKWTSELEKRSCKLLKVLDLWECRNRHPFTLSGGQMQKLTLLLACLSDKPIVVLDEPTAGLDRKSLQSCIELIRQMRQDKIVFVITHDLELISQACTRCLSVSDGKIQDEYDLSKGQQLRRLYEYMQSGMQSASAEEKSDVAPKQRRTRACDPRTKLLYLLASLAVTASVDNALMAGAFVPTLAMCMYEKRYGTAAAGFVLFSLIMLLSVLFPTPVMSFVAAYFPKFILLWLVFVLITEKGDSSRLTAALRRMHVPQTAVMICSVIFRFFPALTADLRILSQSVKTRQVFTGLADKLKRLPSYCEIMIVPMIFRVLRIAQTLSASAETRGIALKRKRQSYACVRFGAVDVVMVILLAAFMAAGIII